MFTGSNVPQPSKTQPRHTISKDAYIMLGSPTVTIRRYLCMTTIKKLTKNTTINDDDLFVVWDSTNSSTRSVTASTLTAYASASADISTCIKSLRIDGNILYATQLNGTETQIGALS